MKSLYSLMLMVLFGFLAHVTFISCNADVTDEPAPEWVTEEVQFKFGGTYSLEPDLLVANITTPKGDIVNARAKITKLPSGSFITEIWDFECGDYILNSWVAYNSATNYSVAQSAGPTPFTVCGGSGGEINTQPEAIPFDQFSIIDKNSTVNASVTQVGDGDLVILGDYQPASRQYEPVYTKTNTKGDVLWRTKLSRAQVFHNDIITLKDDNVVSATNAYIPEVGRNDNAMVRKVNSTDGTVMFEIAGDVIAAAMTNEPSGVPVTYLIIYGLDATPDGGFVLLVYDPFARNHETVKFSSDGTIEWSKPVLTEASLGTNGLAYRYGYTKKVAVGNNGNICIATYGNFLGLILWMYDSNGDFIEVKDYETDPATKIEIKGRYFDIISTTDGGYAVTGVDNTDQYKLVKFNADGDNEWLTFLPSTDDIEPFGRYTSSTKGADGNIVTVATFKAPDLRYAKIYRTNSSTGDVMAQSNIRIGGSGTSGNGQRNYAHGLTETANSLPEFRGVVVVGIFQNNGGADLFAWMYKVPSSLDVPPSINSPNEIVLP